MGDRVSELGLVLSGSVLIENDDLWGNRSILDRIGPGQIFAETYACVPGEKLLVTVTAAEKNRSSVPETWEKSSESVPMPAVSMPD